MAAGALLALSTACGGGGAASDPTEVVATENVVDTSSANTASTQAVTTSTLPEPPSVTEEGDLSLEFALEATGSADASWLLTVVARNRTERVLVDHEYRVLERWSGTRWEAVAVIPYDRTTPGKLLACEPSVPCESDAIEASVQPGELGEERRFLVWPLEDGTYRMSEKRSNGYTVTSNLIDIEGGSVAE